MRPIRELSDRFERHRKLIFKIDEKCVCRPGEQVGDHASFANQWGRDTSDELGVNLIDVLAHCSRRRQHLGFNGPGPARMFDVDESEIVGGRFGL